MSDFEVLPIGTKARLEELERHFEEGHIMAEVESTSDERTVNNAMRHAYRVLTDEERALMLEVKDLGLKLHELLDRAGVSREISIAKTKTEEAVMWAVKHITA